MPRYSAIDLFAGAGGLSLGLIRSGFRVCLAVEHDQIALETYRNNIGNHVISADLHTFPFQSVLAAANLRIGECDLLAGGPPCQGFSSQRRGPDQDLRNDLVLHFSRYILGIKPKMFLMENVSGLLSKRGKPFLDAFLEQVESGGYKVQVFKVEAAEFGVPQLRSRILVIGQRKDLNLRDFKLPLLRRSEVNFATVRDAIGDLPSPPLDGKSHHQFANHARETRISALNIERLKHISPGGGREQLPIHLQLPCHVNNPGHRHVETYGRLHWDRPSGTITARFDSFTRGRFGHPEEHRSLTLREGARLQTFPDNFVFVGNREQGARQIGNAVPVVLASAVADSLIECLDTKPIERARRKVAPKIVETDAKTL